MLIYNKYKFKVPDEKIIRVITNSDAKNEADDQFAIVHTLLSPKFDNVGFVAAHFGEERTTKSVDESFDEIQKIFTLMKFDSTGLICKGASKALESPTKPIIGEGAQLIIKEAMSDDKRPLFVTFMGPLTDLASAYLLEPRIANRLTAIWIGGGKYPNGGQEFNLQNDIIAANIVFKSAINLWQVPKNVYEMMMVSLVELEDKVMPHGEIGNYLCEQLYTHTMENQPRLSSFRSGESWILGDSPVVGLMLCEHRFFFDWIPAPEITKEMTYIHTGLNRPIKVYNYVDSRFILEDFYSKLKLFAMSNNL